MLMFFVTYLGLCNTCSTFFYQGLFHHPKELLQEDMDTTKSPRTILITSVLTQMIVRLQCEILLEMLAHSRTKPLEGVL